MKKNLGKNSDPGLTSCQKDSGFSCKSKRGSGSVSSETEPSVSSSSENQKSSICWAVRPLGLSIFRNLYNNSSKSDSKNSSSNSICRKRTTSRKNHYELWRSAVKRVMMNSGSMRRILGFNRTGVSASKSDIWLLGICYRVSQEGENALDPTHSEGFAAFVEDFSSRIWITYRKGFAPIGDTKYNSDVYWGCMLRSSQMLVAQAFLSHKLGRSWRKSPHMSPDPSYVEILNLFGDAEDSPFSIHNLLQAGKAYGLAPGSWVGPYAMCRTWESLVRKKREDNNNEILSSMMAVYVVSGDEDGERGGAPVLCIEDMSKHCSEFSGGQDDWPPVLLLVPLVLGLEKVNPRYLPLLSATFTFPQSLGVLGGKPGASTYIVGVQDEKAFYLDPHEVQQVAQIKMDVDVDTSTYHSNVVRHIPLDSIDSSLAIGFYCRDKGDFDDFCLRASELINQSNGAPLFTITETRISQNLASYRENADFNNIDGLSSEEPENSGQDDEWQLL